MNYLCQDRMDVGFATKELARAMSSTREVNFIELKRLMQYLQGTDMLQSHLMVPMSEEQQQKRECLMRTIDRLNQKYGRGTVAWAATGLSPSWMMRRERLGRNSTTRLSDVPQVNAR